MTHDAIYALQFTENGHQLLAWTNRVLNGNLVNEIKIYDTQSWAQVGTIPGAEDPLRDGHTTIQTSPDGKLLFLNTQYAAYGFQVIDLTQKMSVSVAGDAANNSIYGSVGSDTLSGGDGNDTIVGYGGADSLDGGDGNDTLYAADQTTPFSYPNLSNPGPAPSLDTGTEQDTLVGGAGDDTIFAGYGDNADGGANGSNGDSLFISFMGATAGVTADFRQNTQVFGGGTIANFESIVWVQGSDFDDDIIAGSSGATGNHSQVVFGMGGNDHIVAAYETRALYGGDGNDILDGRNSAYLAIVDGGAGNDTLYTNTPSNAVTFGGDGDDIIFSAGKTHGGNGNDIIVMSSISSSTTVFGDAGDDQITTSASGNAVAGGAGADTLTGGAGVDALFSADLDSYYTADSTVTVFPFGDDMGLEQDVLSGGGGNDLLVIGYGDSADGGAGFDTLRLSLGGMTSGVTFSTAGLTSSQPFSLGGGTIVNMEALEYLRGTDFADILTMAANTASSNLTVDAGTGDDVIVAGFTGGTVYGNLGNDRFVSLGNATFNGGLGVDTIDYSGFGSGVTVNLTTNLGGSQPSSTGDHLSNVENVDGSAFADTLTGNAGANQLRGMAGNDILDGLAGADTMVGGLGDDTYYVDNVGDVVTEAAGEGADLVISSISFTLSADVDNLTLAGSGGINGVGNALANVITGNSAANVLSGGGGADTLIGGTGDTLIGGAGGDILDGTAGNVTASYLGFAGAVAVDLAAQTAAGGDATGDTLLSIENAFGSAFGDTLKGDAGVNVLSGDAGDDLLDGGADNDQLSGGADNDLLRGGLGDDVLDGGSGNDTATYDQNSAVTVNLTITTAQNTGGAGIDTLVNIENLTGSAFNDTLAGNSADNILNGGGGIDTVSYAGASGGVSVNLGGGALQSVGGGAGADTLISIENLVGSAFSDSLTGDNGDNVIEGAGGNDALDGGSGTDTVSYASASSGVTVSLTPTAAQNTGGAGVDTLSHFENLTGSGFNDTLSGDAGPNVINGLGGSDTVSYAAASAGVTVSLAIAGAQNTGSAGLDTLINVENLTGSRFDDLLAGDAGTNAINGGAGTDAVSYAAAASAVTVDLSVTSAQATGGAGSDTLSNIESLIGSSFNDTLSGNSGANTLDGAGGTDTLSYATASAGVTVSLALSSAQNTGGAGVDTVLNFENLTGSNFADQLTGSSSDNVINGGAGIDTVSYAGASSTVIVDLALTTSQNTGAAGFDTLLNIEGVTGSAFADTIAGGSTFGMFDGGAGNDILILRNGATATGGSGQDAFVLQWAGLSPANGRSALTITDFQAGGGGDRVDLSNFLAGTTWNGVVDPFAGGYLRLSQSGSSTVIQADANGGGDSFGTLVVLQNTEAANLVTANLSGQAFTISVSDIPGDLTTGASLAIGQSADGVIDHDGDTDWYAVNLVAGQHYKFTETGAGSSPLADPYLELFNSNGGLLVWDDDSGPGSDAALGYTALTSGTFYIEAGSYQGAGGYRLSAAIAPPQNPLKTIDLGFKLASSTVAIYFAGSGEHWDTFTAERAWTGSEKTQAMQAWASISAIATVNFVETFSAASATVIAVLDDLTGNTIGLADPIGGGRTAMILDPNAPYWGTGPLQVGGVGFATLIHEMGHVLGLAHPHDNGGTTEQMEGVTDDFGSYGVAGLNQTVFTVMSYNDGWPSQVGHIPFGYSQGFVESPMALDIALLQQKYGAPASHTGDSVYDLASSQASAGFLTLWDTGGIDTIIANNSAGAHIDLRAATLLNQVGGGGYVSYDGSTAAGGFTIAAGVVIENATGGSGADVITGNAANNTLTGGGAADTLTGGGGDDLFRDTAAGLSGDTIIDLSVGDRIQITDANLTTFTFGQFGSDLVFSNGALTLATATAGYHFVASAASQGVMLSLVQNAPRYIDNGLSGDFNGDKRDDLMWRSDAGQMSDWLGQANGGFANNDAHAFNSVPTNWHIVGAGDFNGDGRDDIVWRSDSGQMSDWLGRADGGFVGNDANAFVTIPTNWQVIGTGDFNGDGRDDLLWRSDSGQMSDWLGQANGGFTNNDANAFVSIPTNWHVVGTGDFNGDGRDDLLWRSDAGQLSDWLGQANGGFIGNDANAFSNVPTDWHVVGTGDFNGDGRSDILWRSDAGQLSDWLGKANGGFVGNDANAFVTIPVDWIVAGTGDFNGDGRDDIVWRNTTGAMSDWLGKANGGFVGNDANAYVTVDNTWHIQVADIFGI